ncbi:MaoC family dehydratase [Subtercola lobariae]|uniref:MaoC family dehydratase n=1 Tax=Subtercola lobariae TaxID=1588641 RepID=A0A917B3Y2_9MICO|nr:MaoC family dehydratase [Subtercola lobariae]GGF21781.1 MaoC family dehydratase [Subtercola lobariae]
MTVQTFADAEALLRASGTELGPGEWMLVDQARIDEFAHATNDPQWIHVDAERAAAGPFGGTIAHGFLTLSLLTAMIGGLYRVENVAMGINYGLEHVRFLQPVRSGSRVRASGSVASATRTGSGVRVGLQLAVEIEGQTKPALVAEFIVLYPG